MALLRTRLLMVAAAVLLSAGCRGDDPDDSRTSRTPAARSVIDAGAAPRTARTDGHAGAPIARTPSADFHLDEGSGRKGRTRRKHAAGSGRTLHLTLRSTPTGATAAVDGHVIGATPTYWEGPANGRPREFTFVHAGYAMARYRFVATQDGVVHGTLTKVVVETPDAGTARSSK